jgi:hypothetical protein
MRSGWSRAPSWTGAGGDGPQSFNGVVTSSSGADALPSYDVAMGEVYFDEDGDAAELLAALDAEGYATTLRREAFAGEEDWDDRGWVLVVEPFDERVAALVDVHGGWTPGDPQLPDADPPPLPGSPRRLKRDP